MKKAVVFAMKIMLIVILLMAIYGAFFNGSSKDFLVAYCSGLIVAKLIDKLFCTSSKEDVNL